MTTAEDFALRPNPGHPEELVRGEIIAMPPPTLKHRLICMEAGYLIRRFLEDHPVGRVFANDTGMITARAPDTVRGPDISFYSFDRLPREAPLLRYGPHIPELVVEVRWTGDRWREIIAKVDEYLAAGVEVVIVLDPDPRTAHLSSADAPPRALVADDELTLPSILPGFTTRVGRFFG